MWRGRVTFTRFYLGGNGAAHGGAAGMLFDDLLGRVASGGREACRTASLTINFRRITPVDVEMRFEVTLDRAEDRKRYMSARLMNPAGEVTAEATALFVVLSAGQR